MRFVPTIPRVSSARALVIGAVLVAALFAWATGPLQPLEGLTIDWRYRLRPPPAVDRGPVIVGIGDSAFRVKETAPELFASDPVLSRMNWRWASWDRGIFAEVVRKLRAAGARVIVFDLVFAEEAAGDREFAAALAEPGAPVVLAAQFQEDHSAEGEGTVTFVEPRPEFLAGSRVSTGFANVLADPDNVVRQTVLTASGDSVLAGWSPPVAGEVMVPSLAAQAAAVWGSASRGQQGYVDFRISADRFPQVPIEDLFLSDRWNGPRLRQGRLFVDRIVLVGPWSEIRFKDYHLTPLGRIPGVELQAHAISTLTEGRLLQAAPRWVAVVAILSMTLFATWLVTRPHRMLWDIAGLAFVGSLWIGAACVAFARDGLIVPIVAPVGALLVCGGAGLVLRYAGEQRERLKVRRLLGSYVSEQVARVIERQPEGFDSALRGERRAVTVLFADIRDFTSLAEAAVPEVFIAQLNEYLRQVVDCVLRDEGTLQKFIGDAVLAVWGDTHTAGDVKDATRSVSAALAIERAVSDLNASWTGRPDRVPLRIGVGVHHGPAMVGNVGHPRRMEFAVLGDTVNLASRLEAANKFLGTSILVSETVVQLTCDTFRFLPVARIVVKGRAQSVAVFTPLGLREEPVADWLHRYGLAVATLEAGRFAEAARLFATLPANESRFGPLFAAQAELARQYDAEPPAGWDGTRRFERK